MEILPDCVQHGVHDAQWCLISPGLTTPTCLACVVECLENPKELMLKKKTALSNFLQLIQHQTSAILRLLGQNIPITCHILHTLLELMKDEAVLSVATEACLKLVQILQSEDLVCFLLDGIADSCEKTGDYLQSKTLHILLGRLLQMIPNLVAKFLEDYGCHLHYLVRGLEYPDESVQSAIVFIMIQLCDERVQRLVPPGFIVQVQKAILLLLNVGKEERLLSNALTLLKKILPLNAGSLDALLQTNLDGMTFLSVLRRVMSMKISNLHMTCVQILSSIVQRKHGNHCAEQILDTDLIEFLFEALDTKNSMHLECLFSCLVVLVKLDTFYTKCHSVYGIESVLKGIHILEDIKNADLLEVGLAVLTDILDRQPKNTPLFVNSGSVDLCLSAIHKGLQHHKHQVFVASLKAMVTVVRKEHLLLPIPFQELGTMLQTIGMKVWDHIKNERERICKSMTPKRYRRDVSVLTEASDILELFLKVILKCCSLLLVSSKDPACCRTNFMAPGSTEACSVSDLDVFRSLTVQLCDQACIPTAMAFWEKTDCSKEDGIQVYLLKILLQLYDLSPVELVQVILKLAQSGFMVAVLDIRAHPCCSHTLKEISSQFMVCLCDVLLQQDSEAELTLPQWASAALNTILWKMSDSVKIVCHPAIQEDTQLVFIMVIYLSYKAGYSIFNKGELMKILGNALTQLPQIEDIPSFSRKQLIFLIAVCCQDGQTNLNHENSRACQSMQKLIQSCDPHTWYTHDINLVRWCLRDSLLCHTCAPKMLKIWLEQSEMGVRETEKREIIDQDCVTQRDTDTLVEDFGMDHGFLEALFSVLTTTPELSQRILVIFKQIIMKHQDTEEFASVLNMMRIRGAAHLNNLFLDSEASDCSMQNLLSILCHVYSSMKTQPLMDVKLVYHVMKLLVRKSRCSSALEEIGLQLLIAQFPDNVTNMETKGVPLVVQNAQLMNNLGLWIKGDNFNLHLCSLQLLCKLIWLCSADIQVAVPVTLDVQQLISGLNTDDIHVHLVHLKLLQNLFESGMQSPIVRFEFHGKEIIGEEPALSVQDYRHLLIYLQQFLVQEIRLVQDSAMSCLEKMLIHVMDQDKDLAEDLVSQPWNSFLLDILLGSQTRNALLVLRFVSLMLFTKSGKQLVEHQLPALISTLLESPDSPPEQYFECRSRLAQKIVDLYPSLLNSQKATNLKQLQQICGTG